MTQNYIPLIWSQNWLSYYRYSVYTSICARHHHAKLSTDWNQALYSMWCRVAQNQNFSLFFVCFEFYMMTPSLLTLHWLIVSLYLWQCSQALSRFSFLLNCKILLYSILVVALYLLIQKSWRAFYTKRFEVIQSLGVLSENCLISEIWRNHS